MGISNYLLGMENQGLILEGIDMSKAELKSFIRKTMEDEMKKSNSKSKEYMRKIVKDMMIKQYKFFWEKKSFWVNNI